MKNIRKVINNYQNELQKINVELGKVPAGRLIKRKTTFYHGFDGTEVGITKNEALIRQLCRKKYLLARKKQIELNLKSPVGSWDLRTAVELIASFSSAYQGVPKNYFYDPQVEEWLNKPYTKNLYPMPALTYFSDNGIEYRTKSEVLVANVLERYELPFLYETLFIVNKQRMFPDFVIKNPYHGRLIVWEHFGALDRADYEKKMNEKMINFRKGGYELGENLIYTFESDVADATRITELIENVVLS